LRTKHARLLLAILLAVVVLSCVFIVTHSDHDCVGDGCHTCEELLGCEILLECVGFSAAVVFVRTSGRRILPGMRENKPSVQVLTARKIPLFTDSVRLNI